MKTLTAKQGATIKFTGTRTDSAGAAVDISGQTVTAALVINGSRVDFTIATGPGTGEFTMTIPAATSATISGYGRADVDFTDGAIVVSSDTFGVNIDRDV